MARIGVFAAGMLTALASGCGPGKELPDEVPKPAIQEPSADPGGKAPTVSEPAAKAVLERAVNAITQNKAELLVKAKVSIARFTGTFQDPTTGARELEATLRWEVVWPNRALVSLQFKNGALPSITFRMLHPFGSMIAGIQDQSGDSMEMGRIIYYDVLTQHGVPLGLTLADPEAVVFDMQNADNPPRTTVKIAIPKVPILRVTFDKSSGLPVRVEYHPLEANRRVKKVVEMSAHRAEGGFLLPGTVEYSQNGRTIGRWKLDTWVFPSTIDDSKFELPKP